ncbi:MAG: hypothetical protein WC655_27650 [Candidatus Hydrogenedentales bacterium]|jgi:hypothetical protein
MDAIEAPEQSYLELRDPSFYGLKERFWWPIFYQGIPSLLAVAILPWLMHNRFLWLPYLHDFLGLDGAYSFTLMRLYATVFLIAYAGVVVFLMLYFLPFLNANGRIARHFQEPDGFVVQVRFTPRRYTGFGGWFEDADDVGLLRVEDGSLTYTGDGAQFEIKREDIAYAEHRNIGYRMLWLACNETRIGLKKPMEGIAEFIFSSRQATTLPAARRLNRAIQHAIQTHLK